MVELSIALLVTLTVLLISGLMVGASSTRGVRPSSERPAAYAAFLASALNTALAGAVGGLGAAAWGLLG